MTGRFGNTIRNAMLGLAAATIMGTTACAKQPTIYSHSTAEQTPAVLTIEALPLSVASNCYGAGVEYCSVATTVQDAEGKIYTLEASFLDQITEMSEATKLESAIQAEINDGDKETMEMVVRDAWTKPGTQYEYFDKVTVNGTTFQ